MNDPPTIGVVTPPPATHDHAATHHSQLPSSIVRPISPILENHSDTRNPKRSRRPESSSDSNPEPFSSVDVGPPSPTRGATHEEAHGRSPFCSSCGSYRGHGHGHGHASALASEEAHSHDGIPSTAQVRALLDDPVYQLLRRQVMTEISNKLSDAYLHTQAPSGLLGGLSRDGIDYLTNRQYYGHTLFRHHHHHPPHHLSTLHLGPPLAPSSRASSERPHNNTSMESVASSSNRSVLSNIKSILSGHLVVKTSPLEDIKETPSISSHKTTKKNPSSHPEPDHPNNPPGLGAVVSDDDPMHEADTKQQDLATPSDSVEEVIEKPPIFTRIAMVYHYLWYVYEGTFSNNPYRLPAWVYIGLMSCLASIVVFRFLTTVGPWLALWKMKDGSFSRDVERRMAKLAEASVMALPSLVQLGLFMFPPLLA